ncbi:hypothetical protein R1flu_011508 [Riccia fluitans]|uniref:Uncharacterized protein n=1 Tax=Riccia fluitans TaxID=41844 RepID=A0ABD1Z8E4_9MARC
MTGGGRHVLVNKEENNGSTMYIESELSWTIAVSPSHMKSGLHIQRALLRKLLADFDKVECTESHGYFICVTTLEEICEGKMWESKGYLAHKVRFRCLTFKPQKGEIGFAVVTGECLQKGVICSFGPIEGVFLPWINLKDQFEFIAAKEREPAHFLGKDGSILKTGSVIRVEIRGVKYDPASRGFTTVCKLVGVEKRVWEDTSKPQTPPGGGAEWGADPAPNGSASGWGTTSDANGKTTGGWGADDDNEGGGDWGAPLPTGNGGWGADTNTSKGAWGSNPAETNEGVGDVPGQEVKDGGSWGASPPKNGGMGGGWGANTATEMTDAWGDHPSQASGPISEQENANAGGWESSPAKKNKTGDWSTEVENSGSLLEEIHLACLERTLWNCNKAALR